MTEEAVAEVETAVPAVEAAELAAGDDLSILDGVGPKYADALKAAGVTTFAQLSQMTPEAIDEMLTKANEPLIAGHTADTWPRQAKLAAERIGRRCGATSTPRRRWLPADPAAVTAVTSASTTPSTIQVGGVIIPLPSVRDYLGPTMDLNETLRWLLAREIALLIGTVGSGIMTPPTWMVEGVVDALVTAVTAAGISRQPPSWWS